MQEGLRFTDKIVLKMAREMNSERNLLALGISILSSLSKAIRHLDLIRGQHQPADGR